MRRNNPKTKNNIALIGFSATGKSTIARMIAAYLNWNSVDIDEEIVKQTGKSISEIFEQDGESTFRKLECNILREVCKKNNIVIATGGGLVTTPVNKDLLLKNCIVIHLDAKIDTIYQRLIQDIQNYDYPIVRPLLMGRNPKSRIEKLKASRCSHYQIADWTVHTDNLTTEEVIHEVIRGWNYTLRQSHSNSANNRQRNIIMVDTPSRRYPIIAGWNSLHNIANNLAELGFKGRIIIISDSNVMPLYGNTIHDSLHTAGYKVINFTLPAGESSKNVKHLTRIYDFLISNHVERDDTIISLGGGMVGDITGFAAATYLRGIHWIQVPTTLIGMVDAGIGGKTAINHPPGKNLVGSFYQPNLVFIDLQTLETLPQREFLSGWAEVIKYGLILDQDLFNTIEEHSNHLTALTPDITTDVINKSIQIKTKIVTDDERETSGKRITLNYGHTIGHGIEAVTHYKRYLHGEAVAIGMVAAAQISEQMGFLSSSAVKRIISIIESFSLPVKCKHIDPHEIMQAIKIDKKVHEESIKWVLLKNIGETIIQHNISEKVILKVLKGIVDT